MPAARWDLRHILDVNPDDGTCVGIAKTHGGRCGQSTNAYNRSVADRVLDQMDRSAQLLDTISNLESLASLLLCKRWHNSLKYPGKSQVSEVSGKWENCVREEHLRLRERRETDAQRSRERTAPRVTRPERVGADRVAEMERRVERMTEQMAALERAETERLESLAARVAESEAERSRATHEVTELEEEEGLMRSARPLSEQSPVSNTAGNEDPFVTQAGSSLRPNLFTISTPNDKNAEHTETAEGEHILSTTFTSAEGQLETSELLESIPAVPKHDLSSPTVDHREAITEQENAAPSITSKSSSLAKFHDVFGAKSEPDTPEFQFETPMKLTNTHSELSSPVGTASSTTFSTFSVGTVNSSTTTTPERAAAEGIEQISLQNGKGKAVDIVPPSNFGSSDYAFESVNKKEKEPESEHSATPQRPSIRYDPPPHSSLFFQYISEEDNTPSQISEMPEGEPLTPINRSPSDKPSRPSTPQPRNEEIFGYADITPNSTRYTTYLPARRRHGLLTPPETPEMLLGALSKPISDTGYFRDDQRREDGSPAPRLTRKSLPPSQLGVQGDRLPGEQACGACGERHGMEVACSSSEEKLEASSGCLRRFGFRRLKEKLKAVRESLGKKSETDSEFPG